jgi:ubiquinone/menaquinone biosynthesis C-methylase UbiE
MSSDYFIGVNEVEVDRLRTQHEAWRPETELLWKYAGFTSCRSILDLGCGPGFTSLDLARIVGSSGEICAVDKADSYLELLADRARAGGVTNVRTKNADLAQRHSLTGSFDGLPS